MPIRRPTSAGETPGSASSNSTARNHLTSAIGEPAITVATRSPVCRRQGEHSQHRRDGSQCPSRELQRGHRQVSELNRCRRNSSHVLVPKMGLGNLPSSFLARQPRLRDRNSRATRPRHEKTPSRDWPGSARELVDARVATAPHTPASSRSAPASHVPSNCATSARPPAAGRPLRPAHRTRSRAACRDSSSTTTRSQAGPRLEFLLELAAEDIDAASPEDLGQEGCRRHPMLDRVCPRSGLAFGRTRTAASRERSHRLTAIRSIVRVSRGQHRIRIAHTFSVDRS